MRSLHGMIRLFAAILPMLVVVAAQAQPSDTITANPKAVKLRRIWSLAGNPAGGGFVGQGCGDLGDLDGDGLSEFAVLAYGKWLVYRGKSPFPDTTAIWHLDSCVGDISHPIVGDFWGDGHKQVGFARQSCTDSTGECRLKVLLFDVVGGTLAAAPRTTIDTKIQFCARSVMASDLNGDGVDELVMSRACSYPEVWIYQGGASFDVESPSYKVIDQDRTISGVFSAAVGDLDGDGHMDLVTSGVYGDGAKLKFYWGSDSSFRRWHQPDRVVNLANSMIDVIYGLTLYDCDGDGVEDLFIDGCVFRSRSGRNVRTRAYSLVDADALLRKAGYSRSHSGGYLNDTTHRYAMSIVACPAPDRLELLAFAGGPDGPDGSYEAYYQPGWDGYAGGYFFAYLSAMGDCNGDGWPDLLNSNPAYGFNAGVAVILGGGPDIPRDASLGVEAIAGEGHQDALTVWPVPARDELHIAWRGDLGRMPHRFVVHDMGGREIARGEVESWRGEAVWRCAEVSSGVYVLSVYDERGGFITSARLVKA